MEKTPKRILIVDDDIEIIWYLEKLLTRFGYESENAASGSVALEKMKFNKYDLVLLDIYLPDMLGTDLMLRMNESKLKYPVIILSAHEDVHLAVETTKLGAFDYLVKPVDEERLGLVIRNLLEKMQLENKVAVLTNQLNARETQEEIVTEDEAFMKIIKTAKEIADFEVSAMIFGESGTGKELIARAIHNNSRRKNGPFVVIDCATLPDNLVESELFGHEKGSFTNAIDTRIGRFEMANGGSIFLDEIGNLSLNVQTKLLHVLQEKTIIRVGGKQNINLDVRIITATNINLNEAVKKNIFRDDLLQRINEFYIELPPLRERGDDIRLLSNYFLLNYNIKFNKNVKTIDDEVVDVFYSYSWPGNVRELQNTIKHSLLMASSSINKACLPKNLLYRVEAEKHDITTVDIINNDSEEIKSLKSVSGEAKAFSEKTAIIKALKKFKWNKVKVAKALMIDYKTLHNKIREYEL
ncbi:MAG: sigma-54 dependent transcriptional regulator [bacterium]